MTDGILEILARGGGGGGGGGGGVKDFGNPVGSGVEHENKASVGVISTDSSCNSNV